MRVYAMSDIHGCLNEFEKALSKVDLSGDNKLLTYMAPTITESWRKL